MSIAEELPVLKALVLADQIYTDRDTGKRIIAGTFNSLRMSKFPCRFARSTFAFILLDDVAGEVGVQLRFVHLRDNRVLMQSPGFRLSNPDRLSTVDLAIEIPPFILPEEGIYGLECHVNRQIIGSVRLEVNRQKDQESDND